MAKKIDTRWAAESELRFMKALRGKLEAMTDGDEEVIRDTLEGATDVDPVMETLIRLRNEQEALCDARRRLARDYQEAARSNEAQEEKIKGLILECLQTAGVEQWKGVAGTTYIVAGSWSTEIARPDLVPLQYQKAVPDVAKIKEELSALRQELEAMDSITLIEATVTETGEAQRMAITREELIGKCLRARIPGAALVKGDDTLAIRLPRKAKEAA